MSTTNGGPQPQMAMPQIAVLAQYVKDLSFENPHAPRSLAPSTQQPTINIQVNVEAAPVSETDFEVTLRLEGKAESDGLVLYSMLRLRHPARYVEIGSGWSSATRRPPSPSPRWSHSNTGCL